MAAAVAAFGPAAVLGVDWHSVAAYDALMESLAQHGSTSSSGIGTSGSSGSNSGHAGSAALPYIFLNYRVYHRTASADELAVIEAQEERALRLSAASLVLCRADAEYLRHHFPAATDPAAGAAPLHVLLPALRADMEALPPPADVAAQQEAAAGQEAECGGKHGGVAAVTVDCRAAAAAPAPDKDQQGVQPAQQAPQAQQAAQGRRFLTCCVRISPEKEPHRFVEAVEELQRRGSLERLGVTPLMAGAGWATEYGAALRRRIEAAVPHVRTSLLCWAGGQCRVGMHGVRVQGLAAVLAAAVLAPCR